LNGNVFSSDLDNEVNAFFLFIYGIHFNAAEELEGGEAEP
jgi:hypothetical protein